MKLRNKIVSLALVAAVASTAVVPAFARRQAPTKYDYPQAEAYYSAGVFETFALFATWFGVTAVSESILKKIKKVQQLSNDDRGKCSAFGLAAGITAAILTMVKLTHVADNGGYSTT